MGRVFQTLVPLCLAPTLVWGGLTWPTPNPAFQEGRPPEAFIQPTASGRVESGLFGCVRNDGSRFHEGIDLAAVRRDRRGEAADPVFAILPGRVAYVNRVSGYSSYGRYVVVVHDDGGGPAFHSLYAHLASVAPGIEAGARVEAGGVLGRMGRSAAGYAIPRSRAHLHFEIGFRLSDDFQTWYDRRKFGSVNRHGVWNGMNLVSVDPLAFFHMARDGAGPDADFGEFLRRIPVAARIRVFARSVPDFVKNYPELLTRPLVGEGRAVVAWDIAFTRHGLPKAWTPRFEGEAGLEGRPGDVRLIAYNPRLTEGQTCRQVVEPRGGSAVVSAGTVTTLKKLFGFE